MKSILFITICATMGLFFACSPGGQESGTAQASTSDAEVKGQSAVSDDLSAMNILQIAASSEDHTTLATAVVAAGLEDVLVNAGPLTVFAPNNAAFAKLPEGTVDDLLKPENKGTLARIIKYHASPGKYTVDMLKDGMRLYQATGHYISVARDGDKVSVEGANILGSVEASNGVVHVVDAVLLPPDE